MTLCWTSGMKCHKSLQSASFRVCANKSLLEWKDSRYNSKDIFGRRPLAKCRRSVLHLISKPTQATRTYVS